MTFVSNYARLSFSKFTRKDNKFKDIPKGDQNAIVLYLIIEIQSILGENEDKFYEYESEKQFLFKSLFKSWMNSLLDSNLSVKSIFLLLKNMYYNLEENSGEA